MMRNTTQNLNLPKNMKTARFLFTFVSAGTLTLGLGYAREPAKQPTEQVLHENHSTELAPGKTGPAAGKISEPKDDAHAPKKIGQTGPDKSDPKRKPGQDVRETDPKRKPGEDVHKTEPKKKPGEDLHKTNLARKPAEQARQPELKKPAVAKDGTTMKKAGNLHDPLAKSLAGNEALAPRPGVIRSRGATAALVGRVLIPSNAKFSAGPLDVAATQGKP
jgi:hypothetical protein